LRTKLAIALGLIFFSLAAISLTFTFEPLDDLWVENPFWNGLSKIYKRYKPARLGSLKEIRGLVDDPGKATLLMLGPSKSFTERDVEQVKAFCAEGGRLVLADDFGTGNQLLMGLGLETHFSGLLMLDPLFKEGNRVMPRVTELNLTALPSERELVLNYPTILTNTTEAMVLGYSSSFSYLSDELGQPGEGSIAGPFPVVAEVPVGQGTLVVISDSSPFINSMVDRGDNMAVFDELVSDRERVLIDEAHSRPSRLTQVRGTLVRIYQFLSMTEVRYGLAFILGAIILRIRLEGEESRVDGDSVEEVLRGNPEYSREVLERLHEERGKIGRDENV
jgi:hypothetical protein